MLRIGIKVSATGRAANDIDDLIAQVRTVATAGLRTAWVPQGYDLDTLTALAAVAREVPDIELGASVIPVQPRHPMVLAAQALTTQAASGGRLVLGLGVSHRGLLEAYGMAFERPAARLREHLAVLGPILRGAPVPGAPQVETRVRGAAPPVPVIIGALGPMLLGIAGELADGTITFLAGPRTVADRVVPTITAAAARAGRPAPRVVVGVPVAVTATPDRVRAEVAADLAALTALPSYRQALDHDGLADAGGLVIAGDEETVAAGLARLADLGATDANVTLVGTADDRRRTLRLLAELDAA